MPVCELERYLPTSAKSAEISSLQPPIEISFAPNVGRNSRLEGTGFNLSLEMSRLVSNYNQNLKEGRDHLDAWILSASELEVNVRTFIVEYIQTRTVLPHINRFKEVDGKIRMVGRNGVPVVCGITAEERFGSVLKASEQAEDFLTEGGSEKAENRIAVINSPLGHSGLISEQGKMIRYKSNQTMVFWTDKKGDLHGLTIVSDLNKDQSKQLSVDLGVDKDLLAGNTEAEQVANIVGNPALFSYGRSISNPAKYVFKKILAIRGNSDFRLKQDDGTVEQRSVAQTWEDIEKFESLLKFKPLWEKCLENLRNVVLSKGSKLDNSVIQSELARAIEETILEITLDYLQQIKSPKFNIPQDHVIYFKSFESDSKYRESPINKYAVAAAFLRTRGGCNGGGGAENSILRGISLGSKFFGGGRIGSISETDQYGSLEFECPNPDCKKITRRPRGQLIPKCKYCHTDVRC